MHLEAQACRVLGACDAWTTCPGASGVATTVATSSGFGTALAAGTATFKTGTRCARCVARASCGQGHPPYTHALHALQGVGVRTGIGIAMVVGVTGRLGRRSNGCSGNWTSFEKPWPAASVGAELEDRGMQHMHAGATAIKIF